MGASAKNQFLQAARQFMDWAPTSLENPDLDAQRALELVTNLFLCALRIDPRYSDNYELPDSDKEEWIRNCERFSRLPFKNYASIFNPLNIPPEEPVIGDLADDLADISKDVSEGLSLYQAGKKAAAYWHWKNSFNIHWRYHAVNAIFALGRYTDNPAD